MRTTTSGHPAHPALLSSAGAPALTVRRFVDLARTKSMMCHDAR